MSEIGSGAFGKIYLGYHSLLRCKICLKKGGRNLMNHPDVETSNLSISTTNSKVNFKTASYVNNDNLMREFYYLREFRHHPCITKLYEIIFTENYAYMVLEYYPSGDLFEYVTKKGHLSVDESLRIFSQVLGAVYYLHKNGCCHRDLKLENVLLDKQMNVKLSDFGFTRELPFSMHGKNGLLTEYCGTGAYMAPEIVKRTPYNGIKIDIWALGVMLYTMLTGEMPFDDSLDVKELEYAIIHNRPRFLENIEDIDSDSVVQLQNIKSLLNMMLCKDPEDRISSLEDILKLPVFEPYDGQQQIDTVNNLYYNVSNTKHSWSDLTSSEKAIFKSLVKAGVDKEILKRAIQEETLDSAYGIWALLNDLNERKEKKVSKKRRSVLTLSRSRSIIGNARQVFTSSPIQSEKENSLNMGGGFGANLSTNKSNDNSINTSLQRSGSLKVVRNLLKNDHEKSIKDAGGDKEMNEDDRYSKLNADQHSILSGSTKITNNSSVSKSQSNVNLGSKKHHFSLRSLFKSKNKLKNDSNIPTEQNCSTKNNTMYGTENKTLNRSKKDFKIVPKSQTTPVNKAPILKEEMFPATPEASILKRSNPTRPLSVISNFSTHTSVSETSNGSGYMTGYSTDVNMINGNHNGDGINYSNSKFENRNDETSEKVKRHNNVDLTLSLNPEINYNTTGNSQLLSSPQNSNRPKFSRGISDWSTNMSSQAESPNSSFVALSRSNSMDSLSRSASGRKKNLNVSTPRNRGRSPLNGRMNTKWAFNTVNTLKAKHEIPKANRQNQIIEEESSALDDIDDEDIDDDDDDVDEVTDFLKDGTEKFNKLRLYQGNEDGTKRLKKQHDDNRLSNPVRKSRLYMRKKSMKFPTLPITEESDRDLESELDEEADIEEDDHDYDDDVHTEFSVPENVSATVRAERPASYESGNNGYIFRTVHSPVPQYSSNISKNILEK